MADVTNVTGAGKIDELLQPKKTEDNKQNTGIETPVNVFEETAGDNEVLNQNKFEEFGKKLSEKYGVDLSDEEADELNNYLLAIAQIDNEEGLSQNDLLTAISEEDFNKYLEDTEIDKNDDTIQTPQDAYDAITSKKTAPDDAEEEDGFKIVKDKNGNVIEKYDSEGNIVESHGIEYDENDKISSDYVCYGADGEITETKQSKYEYYEDGSTKKETNTRYNANGSFKSENTIEYGSDGSQYITDDNGKTTTYITLGPNGNMLENNTVVSSSRNKTDNKTLADTIAQGAQIATAVGMEALQGINPKGTIQTQALGDKLKTDEEGNSYIEVDAWDASKDDNMDCMSRIIYNTYGVSLYTDEGQKLYDELAQANGFNADYNKQVIHPGQKIIIPGQETQESVDSNQEADTTNAAQQTDITETAQAEATETTQAETTENEISNTNETELPDNMKATYDEKGNVTGYDNTYTQDDGSTINEHYDLKNHMTNKTITNSDNSKTIIDYEYYATNDSVKIETTTNFDTNGNIVSKVINDKKADLQTDQTFDQTGRVRTETSICASTGNPISYAEHSYGSDITHLVEKYKDSSKTERRSISYEYPNGNKILTLFSHGTPTSETMKDKDGNLLTETTYSVNEDGQIIGTKHDLRNDKYEIFIAYENGRMNQTIG